MHVLLVIDHPNPASFTHAAAARFSRGAEAAGHSIEIADLHAEEFDPRWCRADIDAGEDGAVLPEDVRAEQVRIERCDALCLAFPLYWYGMPAMLKGWIDRVWTYGWAYDQIADPHRSLLRARRGILLIPAGGRAEHWRTHNLDTSMETIWRNGLLGYFGLSATDLHYLNGTEGSDARRAALLDQAEAIGRSLG